jgi:transposase
MRPILIYKDSEPAMAKPKKTDPKREALAKDGVLNTRPDMVRDALFTSNPFFDPDDLLQVRYEMVRRHRVDGRGISKVAVDFGVSRPTFYKAHKAVKANGLAGLLPGQRGPKGGHKLSEEVTVFAARLKADEPEMTMAQCLEAIKSRFGVEVHRRTLERAVYKKKRLE